MPRPDGLPVVELVVSLQGPSFAFFFERQANITMVKYKARIKRRLSKRAASDLI